jgi:hypothetical protein
MEAALLQYVCEWCKRTKKDGEEWILGFAAEKVGPASARREITIIADWSERWASHRLAVHFCSEKHKENFIRALFEVPSLPRHQRTRRTANASRLTSISMAASGGLVHDTHPAKTSRAARSPLKQATQRKARKKLEVAFNAPDDVRAHGLSVRLDDPAFIVYAPTEDAIDLYGGA